LLCPAGHGRYRELFRDEVGPDGIEQIRKATNGNFALGAKRFHNFKQFIAGLY